MKKNLIAVCTLMILVLTAGCARKLIIEETLQLPLHARVYTACNLWYDAENKIRSINIQKGTILPFGTEVMLISATSEEIVFRTVKDKKTYTIEYEDKFRMESPENYMREIFTQNDQENQTEGISVSNIEKLKRGIVEKGMSKKEVLLAYGHPCKFKTPDESLDTWVYWTDFLVGRRVVFNNDKIFEIIEL